MKGSAHLPRRHRRHAGMKRQQPLALGDGRGRVVREQVGGSARRQEGRGPRGGGVCVCVRPPPRRVRLCGGGQGGRAVGVEDQGHVLGTSLRRGASTFSCQIRTAYMPVQGPVAVTGLNARAWKRPNLDTALRGHPPAKKTCPRIPPQTPAPAPPPCSTSAGRAPTAPRRGAG